MDFNISYSKEFDRKNWSIILNCGSGFTLPDNTRLGNYESGLFKNEKIVAEIILIFEVGQNLEVTEDIADYCRENWTQVYDIFPIKAFKGTDFYRSPKTRIGNIEYNFWYCGEDFSCGIHNEHDFFELHTQILGQGEMQKFHTEDEKTIYSREILNPGQTHIPFFNKNREYPYHQYKSVTKCIWLAIESTDLIPR